MKIAMFVLGVLMILGFSVELPTDKDLRVRQVIILLAYLLVAISFLLIPIILK